MRLKGLALILALATPVAAQAADFRLMATSSTSVMVADLGAVAKDAMGVRRVTIYSASFAPMEVQGKIFQFIGGLWAFDCAKGQLRSEGVDIYGPDFVAANHSGTMSQWDTAAGKPPPASDFATYCAASPGKASHASKLAASDWRGAVQAALAQVRAPEQPPAPPAPAMGPSMGPRR